MLRPTAILPGARSVALVLAVLFGFADAATATIWHDGDMVTWPQAYWGDAPNGSNVATVLASNYDTIYAPFGVFEIGSTLGYRATFGSAAALLGFLPASGPVGPLNAELLDPGASSSGAFGGDVATLKLNIDFADAALLVGTSTTKFGDLQVYGLGATADLNDLTIRQALGVMNVALSGAPTADNLTDLDGVAAQLNGAFFMGAPSTFAQDHLAAPVPEPAPPLLLGLGLVAMGVGARSKH